MTDEEKKPPHKDMTTREDGVKNIILAGILMSPKEGYYGLEGKIVN